MYNAESVELLQIFFETIQSEVSADQDETAKLWIWLTLLFGLTWPDWCLLGC